jgi:cytochrome P450
MIKEHRDKESKGTSNADLLYTLLQAQDAEAGIGRMNDSQLKDEVMTIFVAGHETTANALGHFIYYHSIQLNRLVSMKNYVLYLVRTAAIQEFQLLKIYRNWNILKRSLENP